MADASLFTSFRDHQTLVYSLQEEQGEILRPYAPEVHFMSIFSIAYFQIQE